MAGESQLGKEEVSESPNMAFVLTGNKSGSEPKLPILIPSPIEQLLESYACLKAKFVGVFTFLLHSNESVDGKWLP